jgi:hypothetical protein
MLIDVAVSGDGNVINRDVEKILKYRLYSGSTEQWNVKTKVIPVTSGATGTISKSLGQYLNNIPGKHEIKEQQKTAILGTAHIQREVLM